MVPLLVLVGALPLVAAKPSFAQGGQTAALSEPPSLQSDPSFAKRQSNAERVKRARARIGDELKVTFAAAGVDYPARSLLIRIFKREGELEMWGANSVSGKMTLVKTFPICANSGDLGPKRRRGDLQVPEGVYQATAFNPNSSYHLSILVNYPNKADRILGRPRSPDGTPGPVVNLGGDICIHGDCVTIGCIPIQDEPMQELYLAAIDSRIRWNRDPVIHMFPARLSQDTLVELLAQHPGNRELEAFWRNLKEVYDGFEESFVLPDVRINEEGRYVVRPKAKTNRQANE